MEPKIKAAVAEARDLVRQGLLSELEAEPAVEVAGEAQSARQALELTEAAKPDVFVLSAALPGEDPARLVHTITASKDTKVLIFGHTLVPEQVLGFLKTGASGYLPEDSPAGNLARAVCAVNRGEMWVPRKMMAGFFQSLVRPDPQEQGRDAADNYGLSQREREVLCCLRKGYCNQEIADELCISEKTVKNHLSNIFKKLNISQRLQAAMYAVEPDIG